MHNVLAVANYFYMRARAENARDLSPMKLHALVYLAQGWHLAETGKPLFESRVSANRDGAFVPDLREAGCWGTKAMADFVSVLRMDEARGVMVEQKPILPPRVPANALLDWVWKNYGKLSQYDLTQRVHEQGGPWDLIWNDEQRRDDEPKLIPPATMRLWFQERKRGRSSTTSRKATETQRRKAKSGMDKTQRLPAKPNPDRLRST